MQLTKFGTKPNKQLGYISAVRTPCWSTILGGLSISEKIGWFMAHECPTDTTAVVRVHI